MPPLRSCGRFLTTISPMISGLDAALRCSCQRASSVREHAAGRSASRSKYGRRGREFGLGPGCTTVAYTRVIGVRLCLMSRLPPRRLGMDPSVGGSKRWAPSLCGITPGSGSGPCVCTPQRRLCKGDTVMWHGKMLFTWYSVTIKFSMWLGNEHAAVATTQT